MTSNGTRKYKAENSEQTRDFCKIGERYYSTYYLSDLTTLLYPHPIQKILFSSLPCMMSMFIVPTNNEKIIKLLRSRLATLEAKQRERLEKGKLRDHRIDRELEEDTMFVEELVSEVEKAFDVSLYMTLQVSSKEELQEFHDQLKNITDSSELFFTRYTYQQKKAFESILPFNTDTIKEKRLLPSSALAYLMPFITKNIYHPQGILLGVAIMQQRLLFIDPFTIADDPMRNSNITILGVSGSGKSVTSKTISTRLFMRRTQIIVIDPEGEYLNYAKAMGGEIIQFSRENGLIPFSLYSNEKADIRAIKNAIEAGITHIDTAEKYAEGYAEMLVGRAIKGYDRKKLFLVTKIAEDHLHYTDVFTSLNNSLERLQTDYLDMYMIHGPSLTIPIEETMKSFDEVVAKGLVRHIAVSNFNVERFKKAQAATKNKIVAGQYHLNLKFREPERKGILSYFQINDVIMIAWRPVQKGLLASQDSEIIKTMCNKYGKTPSQIAINWLISQKNVVTLSKMRNLDHLKENLGAIGWQMEKEDIEKLDKEFPNQQDISDAVPLTA